MEALRLIGTEDQTECLKVQKAVIDCRLVLQGNSSYGVFSPWRASIVRRHIDTELTLRLFPRTLAAMPSREKLSEFVALP